MKTRIHSIRIKSVKKEYSQWSRPPTERSFVALRMMAYSLWIGQEKSFKNYRYNKFDKNSIKSNSVWSLFVDTQGRIWIGYYNSGVGIYDKFYDKFKDIESLPNAHNSLQSSSITGIVQDRGRQAMDRNRWWWRRYLRPKGSAHCTSCRPQ